jgi:hypothetical protein
LQIYKAISYFYNMSSKYKFADNGNPDSYGEYFVSFAVTCLKGTDTHTREAMLHICASGGNPKTNYNRGYNNMPG